MSLHLLALLLKPSLSGLRAPDHLLFTPFLLVVIQVTRRGRKERSLIGRGVLTTLPLVGPFVRPVGAQSTAQPWHTDPLTPEGLRRPGIEPGPPMWQVNILPLTRSVTRISCLIAMLDYAVCRGLIAYQ